MTRQVFLITLVLFGAGCSDGAPAEEAVLVTDSAGVRVVEHTSSVVTRLEIAEQAELLVGGSADGSDVLYRVRGGVLLPDGGVAIANAGSQEILYFAGSGDLIRRVGGQGEGPREFSRILWMQNEGGGELSVYDPGNLRISRLNDRGEFVRTQSVRIEAEARSSERMIVGRGFPLGVAEGGRVLAIPSAVAAFDGVEGPLPLRGELRNYSSDLSEFEFVDSVRLRTWYEKEQEEGPPIAQVLESPILVSAANRNWIAYSEATTHRVTVLEDGRVSYVVLEARPRAVFIPDSVPAFYAGAADSLPAYRALQVDSDGRVWVASPSSGEQGVSEWRVFSQGGLTVQALILPGTTVVLDAIADRLLLLERDSLDVETVVVRRMTAVAF